jgi:uncharacterized membrane protein HdeD (DUF308 family)
MFILSFYVLPFLLGIALRVLLNRLKKPYLVTVVLGIAVLIAGCISLFNMTEAGIIYGMLARQISSAFVGSLAIEVVFGFLGIY